MSVKPGPGMALLPVPRTVYDAVREALEKAMPGLAQERETGGAFLDMSGLALEVEWGKGAAKTCPGCGGACILPGAPQACTICEGKGWIRLADETSTR